jgi:GT2 family glycosyltransferase
VNDLSYFDFLKKSKFNFKKFSLYRKAYKEILKTDLFDKEFYLNTYYNVAKSGMDPLIHYLFYGGNEGKYPSLKFNGNKYLYNYPEVLEYDINPLVHYILKGQYEGKKAFKVNSLEVRDKIIKNNLLFLNNYVFDFEPLVSIIVLNRNGLVHLERLFDNFSFLANYNNFEVVVVDNASVDGSVDFLKSLSVDFSIKIIENDVNKSFSEANNQAVDFCDGDYVLLLNNDMEPTFGWLNEMMGVMLNNDNVGAVGAKLVYPYYYDRVSNDKSFTIQHVGVKIEEVINNNYVYGPYHENINNPKIFEKNFNITSKCIAVTAAAVLIKKSIYKKLNGLDKRYNYGYEDVDFMLKLNQKGYDVLYSGSSLLFHHESSTRNDEGNYIESNYKNILSFNKKWNDYLFKKLLMDKINKQQFFTNKKLKVCFIKQNNILEEKSLKKFPYKIISKLSKELNEMDYNIDLISNLNDYNIGKDTDIVLSFDLNYKIENIFSRKNIIKIVFISDYNSLSKDEIFNIKKYDIILTKNKVDKELILEELKITNVFYLNQEDKICSIDLLNLISNVYIS